MNAIVANDFKSLIKNEFLARCRRNPQYSLRAFAKALAVSPAALSGMLNGRRSITHKSVEKMGRALGLSPEEIKILKRNRETEDENQHFAQIALDSFSFISDWYHDAILEFMKVEGFKTSPDWIAKRLNLTTSEVNAAIERLIRLGLIIVHPDGSWQDQSNGFSTTLNFGKTSDSAKRLQKQLVMKSYDAIDSVDIERRDHTGLTMAIDPADLPKARALIKQFRRQLSELLERPGAVKKEVYQLTVGIFPLTQNEKDKA